MNCFRWRLHKKDLLVKFLEALNGNIYFKIDAYTSAMNKYLPNIHIIDKPFLESGAWFSGFMEGDGSFIIQDATNNFNIFFQVSCKKKELLLKIKEKFNGNIYFDKSWKGYIWRAFNISDLFNLFLYFTRYPLLSSKNSDILTLKRFFCYKLMKYHLDFEKIKKLNHLLILFKKRKKI